LKVAITIEWSEACNKVNSSLACHGVLLTLYSNRSITVPKFGKSSSNILLNLAMANTKTLQQLKKRTNDLIVKSL
jgi:hypothetical protein